MKKTDVQINSTYLVKVAGHLVPVRIDREHDNGGWVGTSRKTGKQIRIKSPQRLRKCLDDAAPVAKKAAKATKDATDSTKRHTGEPGATGASVGGKPMSLLDASAHLLSREGQDADRHVARSHVARDQGEGPGQPVREGRSR